MPSSFTLCAWSEQKSRYILHFNKFHISSKNKPFYKVVCHFTCAYFVHLLTHIYWFSYLLVLFHISSSRISASAESISWVHSTSSTLRGVRYYSITTIPNRKLHFYFLLILSCASFFWLCLFKYPVIEAFLFLSVILFYTAHCLISCFMWY